MASCREGVDRTGQRVTLLESEKIYQRPTFVERLDVAIRGLCMVVKLNMFAIVK